MIKRALKGSLRNGLISGYIFLKERTIDNRTGKSHYTHKRLRSAYLSVKRNMIYLWTWYDNIEVGIPNTNNGLEGQFSDQIPLLLTITLFLLKVFHIELLYVY